MMRPFNSFIAGLRYFFILAVLALAVMSLGSLARGVYQMVNLAVSGGFAMEPGDGATVVSFFIRAAFLYFLAVAIGSLFLGDVPSPQWMTVRNLFQFRTKVLTFVSVILPLGFMGKMMGSDIMAPGIFYSGAGVFLVLMGIFFLTRFGVPSGDEGMAREGNRSVETRPQNDRKPEKRSRTSRRTSDQGPGARQGEQADKDEWLKKQKEDLKFQKETLEKAVEKDFTGGGGARQNGSVTVRPGPKRPRGRRR